MQLQLNTLSEDEKLRRHTDSLKLLSDGDVKFMSDKALEILDVNGAGIDRNSHMATHRPALY